MTLPKRRLLGFFAGASLFLAFIYLYPTQTHAPAGDIHQQTAIVSAEEQKPQGRDVGFTAIDAGTGATAKNRKNYAIYTQEEFNSFWNIAQESSTQKAPEINFKKSYVVAVFAGAKPTTGYGISVTKVTDVGSSRNIQVTITEPGAGCSPEKKKTSPYAFVLLPLGSETSLSHTDLTKKTDCR